MLQNFVIVKIFSSFSLFLNRSFVVFIYRSTFVMKSPLISFAKAPINVSCVKIALADLGGSLNS